MFLRRSAKSRLIPVDDEQRFVGSLGPFWPQSKVMLLAGIRGKHGPGAETERLGGVKGSNLTASVIRSQRGKRLRRSQETLSRKRLFTIFAQRTD